MQAFLRMGLGACGMGRRQGGVFVKVYTKFSEHFGWEEDNGSTHKSLAWR